MPPGAKPAKARKPVALTGVGAPSRHEEQVLLWRRERFQQMGYDETRAALLAHSNIDLHRMEDLLGKGATPEQALRILMGTDVFGDDPTWSDLRSEREEEAQ